MQISQCKIEKVDLKVLENSLQRQITSYTGNQRLNYTIIYNTSRLPHRVRVHLTHCQIYLGFAMDLVFYVILMDVPCNSVAKLEFLIEVLSQCDKTAWISNGIVQPLDPKYSFHDTNRKAQCCVLTLYGRPIQFHIVSTICREWRLR